MGRTISLSDTVGFIRDLPHGLVEAFEATLQEAVDADLLLHVVDAASLSWPEQIDEVQRVLTDIGADGIEQILVFNKVDALPPQRQPLQAQDSYAMDGKQLTRVYISAQRGLGLDALRQAIADAALRATGASMAEAAEAERDWYSQPPDDAAADSAEKT